MGQQYVRTNYQRRNKATVLSAENNQKGTVKSAQFYVQNACYNLKIALLLHKMTTANKSPIFLNSSTLVILWCLTKRKPDKLQEGPVVMDIEGILTKLLQFLHLLCQCFNSTCFERLFCHLSCIQLSSLRRWVHFLHLSWLFWLGFYMGLSMAKQNVLL